PGHQFESMGSEQRVFALGTVVSGDDSFADRAVCTVSRSGRWMSCSSLTHVRRAGMTHSGMTDSAMSNPCTTVPAGVARVVVYRPFVIVTVTNAGAIRRVSNLPQSRDRPTLVPWHRTTVVRATPTSGELPNR